MCVADILPAKSSLNIGVYHLARNRTGANNRHLDHKVVKAGRPCAGQRTHLRPALNLEQTNRVCLLIAE